MSESEGKKDLRSAYTVDPKSSFWTFVKYSLTGGVFLGVCKLSSLAGVHPLWLVPFFSLLATIKAHRRETRNLRLETLRALLSSDQRLLARVEDLPKWVMYPDMEKAEWVNKIIVRMWPNICHYVRNLLMTTVGPAVAVYVPAFKFESISLGDKSPYVGGIRVYEENTPRGEIIMDMEIIYVGDSVIKCSAVKGFKAGIKEIEFSGIVRVILTPLLKEMPLVGAVQAFFLNPPYVDFNLTDMGDVFDFPGISDVIRTVVTDTVSSIMVLPNKFMIPLTADIPKADVLMPKPRGVLRVYIVEAKDLEKKDIGLMGMGKSDPFIKVTVGSQTEKTKHIENTVTPVWNFCCEMLIDAVHGQVLLLEVYDYDQGVPGMTKHDFLGSETLEIKSLACAGETDSWYTLKDVKKGEVHIKTSWKNLSNSIEDLKAEEERVRSLTGWRGPKRNTAALLVLLESVNSLPTGRGKVEPDPKVILTIQDKKQESVVKYKSTDVFYDQSFTFLVRNVHEEKLYIKVIDARNSNSLGEGSFDLSELIEAENLEILPKVIEINSIYNSTITLFLQLRILKSGIYGDTDEPGDPPIKSRDLQDVEKQVIKDDESSATSVGKEVEELIIPCVEETVKASDASEHTRSATPPALDEAVKSTVTPVAGAAALSQVEIPAPSSITNMKTVGEIQLTLRYNMVKCELVVVVHQARNLPLEDEDELPDPYVKLYLLPDRDRGSKRKTKAIKDSCNPVYDERMEEYHVRQQDLAHKTLLVIVISKKRSFEIFKRSPVIGEARIELGSYELIKTLTNWWPLYPSTDGEE